MIDFSPRYAAYASHEMAQRMAALLMTHGGIRLAYLFGSQARNDATRESDIDVAVSLGKPMQAADKERLIGDIGAAFGRPVDLIDMERSNGAILGRVFKEGIRLIDDPVVRARIAAHRADWQTDVAPYIARLRTERRAAWLGRG